MPRAGDVLERPNGSRLVFLQTSQDTNGQLVEVDIFVKPGSRRGPETFLHMHPSQEERLKVIAGTMTARIGKNESTLRAGDEAIVRPKTPHAWRNSGDSELQVRAQMRPGTDFDRFLETEYAMVLNRNRNPLQWGVTFWGFRHVGGPPLRILLAPFAILALMGRLFGLRPDIPYTRPRTT
jgi:quercetin dioxygenase-like cupin family protein